MSHVTVVKQVSFSDQSAINAAAAELKLNIKRNVEPRMWSKGQYSVCPTVLYLNEGYDVGFKADPDGFVTAAFDNWNGSISRQLGAGDNPIGKFQQVYTKFAIINAALSAGYIISAVDLDSEGNVMLEITND